MIGQWTEGMFQFERVSAFPAVSQSTETNSLQEDKKCTCLQEVPDDYGITESVLPTTIPDGFVLVNIGADESPDFGVVEFYAFYEKGGAALSMLATKHLSDSGSLKYEKDENPVREYVENGTA